MTEESRNESASRWSIALALALLMALTRIGHLGEFSRLPDASWAVFFLGGLLLRDARHFVAFFLLAWVVDVAALMLGTPADCFSLAYLALLPAYGALWWGGRLAARTPGAPVARLGRGAAALAASVVVAFIVSNLGFHAFGPDSGLSTTAYALRVAGFLPAYLLVAAVYSGAALAAGAVALRLRAPLSTRR